MADTKTSDLEASYDRVADEYVARISDELGHKPLDRQLLDRFAEQMRSRGTVGDVGCGPGHVARYLHERGVRVRGIDLSPRMVAAARRLNPPIEFTTGDMRSLAIEDEAWAGIVAFYSIIHIPRPEVVTVLAELKRVLQPAGLLLLAFHIGDHVLHLDEWWGHRVSVDFLFFRPEEMQGYLRQAGFEIMETIERDPYPSVEHPSRRAYIFAQKPSSGPEHVPVRQ